LQKYILGLKLERDIREKEVSKKGKTIPITGSGGLY
jgi:hypothetical protein